MARSPLLLPRERTSGSIMATSALGIIVLAALAAGIGSAAGLMKERPPFGAVGIGLWSTYPLLGSGEVDPYGRAILTRAPHLPLAAGEGVQFVAASDRSGAALYGDCRYRISGMTLPSRGWSLAVADADGRSLSDPAQASWLTDADLVTGKGGAIDITAAPTVAAGNWLRLPTGQRLAFVLRFYDTPLSATVAVIDSKALPDIERIGCAQ